MTCICKGCKACTVWSFNRTSVNQVEDIAILAQLLLDDREVEQDRARQEPLQAVDRSQLGLGLGLVSHWRRSARLMVRLDDNRQR